MPEPALTPALALDYLDELSTDIRGAVLLDAKRRVVAGWRGDSDRADRLREPLIELLDCAAEAAGDSGPAAQVEVTTQRGAVFCVTRGDFTLAVVTGRVALPALVFYDLRHVLEDLEGASG